MKSKQRGELLLELVASIILLVVIGIISMAFASYQCSVHWENSGMKSEYRIGAGCMVQKPDGKWLPAKSLRDTDI